MTPKQAMKIAPTRALREAGRKTALAWGEAYCATYAAPAVVMCHSGRADGWWRPVMTGMPESCGKEYEARRRRLRQGGVAVYVRPRSDLPAELLLETAPRPLTSLQTKPAGTP